MKIFAYAIAFALLVTGTHLLVYRAISFANDVHQMSEDINAIRKTLAPFPISFEQPEMRQHVMLREDSHQEPEVTLL